MLERRESLFVQPPREIVDQPDRQSRINEDPRSNLNRRRSREEELKGIVESHDPAHANHRDTDCRCNLIDHANRNRLDCRAGDSAGVVCQERFPPAHVDGHSDEGIDQRDRVRAGLFDRDATDAISDAPGLSFTMIGSVVTARTARVTSADISWVPAKAISAARNVRTRDVDLDRGDRRLFVQDARHHRVVVDRLGGDIDDRRERSISPISMGIS